MQIWRKGEATPLATPQTDETPATRWCRQSRTSWIVPHPRRVRAPCEQRGRSAFRPTDFEIDGRRHDPVAHRQDAEDRLHGAGRPQQVADRGFGRRHRDAPGRIADEAVHGTKLDLVAKRRRCAVRVDVVELGGADLGALERGLHAAIGAVAFRRRRGDVISVARHAVADHLGIDRGAARLGVLQLLEHHDARPLAHHEAVAVAVIGTRRALGRVVEMRRKRARGGKARERQPVDRGLGAARDHDVRVAQPDQPRGVADRMRAGRAGGDHGMIGAFQAECDRDIAGGEVDQAARDEERRHPARALLMQNERGLGDAFDAADAGADHHAGRDLVLVAFRLPAGVGERLTRGAERVGNELVDLALLLRLHPLIGIVGAAGTVAARDLAGDLGRQVGDVELFDSAGAALSGDQSLPRDLDAASERRDHAKPCDNDTPHAGSNTGRSRRPPGAGDVGRSFKCPTRRILKLL